MGRLSSCDSIERLAMGAYVLGALDPVERARFEEHASKCDVCREELAQLSGLPGLLSRVTLEEALAAPAATAPPPPARRRRRAAFRLPAGRSRRAAFGAVAAMAAVAVALVLALSTGNETSSGTPQTVTAVNQANGVAAAMRLRPTGWGTEVRVRLRGVLAGTRCRLMVVSRNGTREIAGTWRADYEGEADVKTATSIPRSDLASLQVIAGGGRPLVRADL